MEHGASFLGVGWGGGGGGEEGEGGGRGGGGGGGGGRTPGGKILIWWGSKKLLWMVGVPHGHPLCPPTLYMYKIIYREYIESIYLGVILGHNYVRVWNADSVHLFFQKFVLLKAV